MHLDLTLLYVIASEAKQSAFTIMQKVRNIRLLRRPQAAFLAMTPK
jgi:hypothetical protein